MSLSGFALKKNVTIANSHANNQLSFRLEGCIQNNITEATAK